jgi:hypothetical protein
MSSTNTDNPEEGGDTREMNMSITTPDEDVLNLNTNASLGDTTMDLVQQRILHVLSIYPRLSMSMLQIGIGTGFPPAIWHPALDALLDEGRVRRDYVKAQNPVSRREQAYTVIQLKEEEDVEAA